MIVDDEKGIREALKQVLEYEEIEVQACASGHEAIRAYPDFKPHLVFLDVKMEGMDGLEALQRVRELDPQAQVVMISGHGSIQTAVEATQLGAYDFLEKPLDTDRILLTLRNALQHVVLVSENVRLKQEVRAQYEIVGSSKAIRHVIDLIEKVAPTPARVLITGDNGTGKELVARAIHALSPRATGPFVEVNCAAIPTELIESELFGHMKGSFTGAFTDRAGKSIAITRRDQPGKPLTVQLARNLEDHPESNVPVYSGDTIMVRRADVIYVVGDVAHPSGLLMGDGGHLSVLQAIALAGGTGPTAKLNGARIIRKGPLGLTETPVPLKKLLQAKADDIQLEADDILFVPTSARKFLEGRTAEAALQMAMSASLIMVRP